MNFNLNEFLSSVSNALDAVEIDLFGVPTNHSKRIAFIATRIGFELNIEAEALFDLAAIALMHDNGATMKILEDNLNYSLREKLTIIESRKEHCIIGESNIQNFPFLTNPHDVLKYHHENYDGSGFFGLIGDEIPLFSQIIHLADNLDLNFEMNNPEKEAVLNYVKMHLKYLFSPKIADVFIKLGESNLFWEALFDENINTSLKEIIPNFSNEMSYKEVRFITQTFSRIIDAKSVFTQKHSTGLSNRMLKMVKFYRIDAITKYKLLISCDLHDLGKLAISNKILDKKGKLTSFELNEMKKHPDITKQSLFGLSGFSEIAIWAGNHHEKLNGSGYPHKLMAEDLDFNSRLITCLDIYQALREKRPYRKAMNHANAMQILTEMVNLGEIDYQIVLDIAIVFGKNKGNQK